MDQNVGGNEKSLVRISMLHSKILMIGQGDCAERLVASGAGMVIRHKTGSHTTQDTGHTEPHQPGPGITIGRARATIQDTDRLLSSVRQHGWTGDISWQI